MHYAIVDEADAQLVDNATNPFMISRATLVSPAFEERVRVADEVHRARV